MSFDVATAVLAITRGSVCNQYEKKTKNATMKVYAALAVQT